MYLHKIPIYRPIFNEINIQFIHSKCFCCSERMSVVSMYVCVFLENCFSFVSFGKDIFLVFVGFPSFYKINCSLGKSAFYNISSFQYVRSFFCVEGWSLKNNEETPGGISATANGCQ